MASSGAVKHTRPNASYICSTGANTSEELALPHSILPAAVKVAGLKLPRYSSAHSSGEERVSAILIHVFVHQRRKQLGVLISVTDFRRPTPEHSNHCLYLVRPIVRHQIGDARSKSRSEQEQSAADRPPLHQPCSAMAVIKPGDIRGQSSGMPV
jgi:hypothetical protein